MWNFKAYIWNSTQNILPIHWKMQFIYSVEIFRVLRFKSSLAFRNDPSPHPRCNRTTSSLQFRQPCRISVNISYESTNALMTQEQQSEPQHKRLHNLLYVMYCMKCSRTSVDHQWQATIWKWSGCTPLPINPNWDQDGGSQLPSSFYKRCN